MIIFMVLLCNFGNEIMEGRSSKPIDFCRKFILDIYIDNDRNKFNGNLMGPMVSFLVHYGYVAYGGVE